MKGDFSRDTFDRKKHYSAVLMQQGRVQDDADWNEGQSIEQYRNEVEATDVIGQSGAPRRDPGFKISTNGTTITIGKGRYYVDGLLCENETDLEYDAQNAGDLPGASVGSVFEALKNAQTPFAIAYLDVWKRQITSLEDPLIREVALGGADTATRVRVVWQVKILPVAVAGTTALQELFPKRTKLQAQVEEAKSADAQLTKQFTSARKKLDATPPTAPDRPQLEELVKKITEQRASVAQGVAKASADLEKVNADIERLTGGTTVGCSTTFEEWEQLPELSTGTLKARTGAPGGGDDPCLPPPSAGYRRLSNQLYRVEVHDGGPLGTATFKWSRDNGTVVTSIEKITGNTIVVHDLGRDEELGFRAGDWVELIDDGLELIGLPGQLAQINPPNEATREITLAGATPLPLAPGPGGVDPARHPKLRRWDQLDQQPVTVDAHGIKTAAGWIPLEDGIEVQFGQGDYRSGDYWLIPARTSTGDVEWPPFASPNTNPSAEPPHGIRHHFAKLGILHVNDGTLEVLDDCRPIFCPLTDVPCGSATSLHVVATSWANDDVMPIEPQEGIELRVTLDAAPDAESVTDASVIVMIESPLVTGQQVSRLLYQRLVLNGQVGVDAANPRVIVWQFNSTSNAGLQPLGAVSGVSEGRSRKRGAAARAAAAAVEPGRLAGATTFTIPRVSAPRLLVFLKGSLIWRDDKRGSRRYLDGQAFGAPGIRADGTVNTGLTFPSGAGTKASDFESWFYIGRTQTPAVPLRITTVTFVRANGQPSSAGPIAVPLPEGSSVRFKASEQIRFIDIAFNRRIVKLEQAEPAKPQSIVVLRSVAAGPPRVLGRVSMVSETVARFEAVNPEVLLAGPYTLRVLGDAADAPAVTGDPDGPRLDGNFDNVEGGEFTLPFTAV